MYAPADNFEAEFQNRDIEFYRRRVALAKRFSLALHRHRITSDPGQTIRTKIGGQLRTLGPVVVQEMYAVNRWLGTTTRASLVVVGEIAAQLRELMTAAGDGYFCHGQWQDLALYSSNKILYAREASSRVRKRVRASRRGSQTYADRDAPLHRGELESRRHGGHRRGVKMTTHFAKESDSIVARRLRSVDAFC
jgi:hypothetical protein